MAKYKYILTAIIILCAITTFAQPAQYTPMTAAGYQMKRLKVDSTLHLPSFCGVPTLRGSLAKDGALAIDTCGGYLYMWTNQLGWDTINVTTTGGGGNQDLQSVLNNGNTSYNRDINLLGRSSGNQIYISPLDNNWMPFMALGDSIGGGVYQYTYPQATIEFINKYMSQKLIGQDSTRSIIYLPVQTIDATDTLAKLSDVRAVSGSTIDTTSLSNRINSKLSISDTASMLTNYFNQVNYGLTKSGKTISVDSATLSNKYLRIVDTTNKFVNRITRTAGKDSIIYFVGGTRLAIKDSVGSNPAPVGYYGAFQDNTSQTAASINTAYAVKLNTTDLTNGVSVVNDGSSNPTRVTLANTGIYNIQFSLQLEKTGGSGNMIADIWIRKNGIDIPSTTGKVVLTGSANASPIVAAWNYVLDLTAGDYIQLMWATSNTNVEIVAAGATAPHPSIPSAILTVTQQSGIMAGTGITAINSLTGAAQTITTGTSGTDFAVSSTGTTHTLNLPTASATNRGALSTTDWSTFNGKLSASDTVSLSNRINGKLSIADTSALQRKSIPAYSMLANNTNATANATAQAFKDTSGVYSGTITWTGTTAPSGATNHTFRITQVGKCVTINVSLVYATNGSSLNRLVATLPASAPTPAQPTGLTSASQNIYVANTMFTTSTNTTANLIIRSTLRNNTSNNGFEFFIEMIGSNAAQANITCQYWTN